MPIGKTSGARPKRLPSCQAFSSGRRLTGTIARISAPRGSSPWSRSQPPMAPDTHDSSTSLIEQFRPRPMTLTASRGIGSLQATTLRPIGLPFSRVGESSAINASAARSPTMCSPALAMSSEPSNGCFGLASRSIDLATPLPYMSSALTARPVSGLSTASDSQSASGSSTWSSIWWRCGGSLPPSVIEFITEVSAMPSPMQW